MDTKAGLALGALLLMPLRPALGRVPGPPPLPGYHLAWHDEFDGTSLDPASWNAEEGPRRDARNCAESVQVAGGVLAITTFTRDGHAWTGFLTTRGKYEFTYGYAEARIRFSSTPGEWGAFWLHTDTMGNPLGDTAKAGTEIDIAEHRAQDQAGRDIAATFQVNLHWDGYAEHHHHVGGETHAAPGHSFQGEWHTYAVLWDPSGYRFFLDGRETCRTSAAVSRKSEYLLLTCEEKNDGWAGPAPAGGYGSKAESRTKMEVDWVRVWQKGR